MKRSKFNVAKDKEKRSHNGIMFDSQLEMKYYRDVLCPKLESGLITNYQLQKKYELQSKFIYKGKTVQPINYVADFYIEYSDGSVEVIDTKGCPDATAKLKRKMFWCKYPNINYRWITYVQKWGGWLDYQDVQALRREDKKNKNKLKEN